MIRKQIPSTALADHGSNQPTVLENNSYSVSGEYSTFETTDGGVITQYEVAHAVDKGVGIFIGNYFVGVTESYQCYINSPFGRYS